MGSLGQDEGSRKSTRTGQAKIQVRHIRISRSGLSARGCPTVHGRHGDDVFCQDETHRFLPTRTPVEKRLKPLASEENVGHDGPLK